jgi:hypothetical protein
VHDVHDQQEQQEQQDETEQDTGHDTEQTRSQAMTKIPELDAIEFDGAAAVAAYSKALRDHGRALAAELDASAEEIEVTLARQGGHPLLMGVDTRMRARRVSRRLRRASELAGGIALEGVRFNAEFRHQFEPVIEPAKKRTKKDFDFHG